MFPTFSTETVKRLIVTSATLKQEQNLATSASISPAVSPAAAAASACSKTAKGNPIANFWKRSEHLANFYPPFWSHNVHTFTVDSKPYILNSSGQPCILETPRKGKTAKRAF
jgi:hypothetical protein